MASDDDAPHTADGQEPESGDVPKRTLWQTLGSLLALALVVGTAVVVVTPWDDRSDCQDDLEMVIEVGTDDAGAITAEPEVRGESAFDRKLDEMLELDPAQPCEKNVTVAPTTSSSLLEMSVTSLDNTDARYGITLLSKEENQCTYQGDDGTLSASLCAWVPVASDDAVSAEIKESVQQALPDGYSWPSSEQDLGETFYVLRIEDLEEGS